MRWLLIMGARPRAPRVALRLLVASVARLMSGASSRLVVPMRPSVRRGPAGFGGDPVHRPWRVVVTRQARYLFAGGAARCSAQRLRVRIGITGHCDLTAPSMILVERALRENLSPDRGGELVGVSCLARGADQAFARVVLDLGGKIEVVLPAEDYRDRKVDPDNAAEFDRLLAAATGVQTVAFARSCRAAYIAASDTMLAQVDRLVAVWDGRPATRPGSTADVVAAAWRRHLPVTVVWPHDAARGTAIPAPQAATHLPRHIVDEKPAVASGSGALTVNSPSGARRQTW